MLNKSNSFSLLGNLKHKHMQRKLKSGSGRNDCYNPQMCFGTGWRPEWIRVEEGNHGGAVGELGVGRRVGESRMGLEML